MNSTSSVNSSNFFNYSIVFTRLKFLNKTYHYNSLFFKEQKLNKTAPFYDLEKDEIASTMLRAMKNTDRYRGMKKSGKSDKEIKESFNTKREMKVFSWRGTIDTVFTPYDSIKYYILERKLTF